MNIYQMSHYDINNYFKYMLRNFLFYNLIPILIILISLVCKNIYIYIISSIYILFFMCLHYYIKPRLKFTRRALRLFIFAIVLAVILNFIPYLFYLNILLEFIIIPCLLVESMLSRKINKKYLDQAKNKFLDYKGTKIAITGSYGKTSTKNIFNQILNIYEKTIMTPSSYNTPLGIARFINSNNLNFYRNTILEFGASKKNDIKELVSLFNPDIALVTEIGAMHLESFKSIQTIIDEKMSICNKAKLSILNFENEYIRNYNKENINYISYGISYGDYRAKNISTNEFDFYFHDEFLIHIKHNMEGSHQVLNILALLSYLHYSYYDLSKASRALETMSIIKNRLEIKHLKDRTIIDDSFNSNIKGFKSALNILGNYKEYKVLITPGMVELGNLERKLMKELSPCIVANTDAVILVGFNKTRILYEELREYNILIFTAVNFKEAYKLYLKLTRKIKSVCLIENDLPEVYRKGFLF